MSLNSADLRYHCAGMSCAGMFAAYQFKRSGLNIEKIPNSDIFRQEIKMNDCQQIDETWRVENVAPFPLTFPLFELADLMLSCRLSLLIAVLT